jgi:hypothetical protein
MALLAFDGCGRRHRPPGVDYESLTDIWFQDKQRIRRFMIKQLTRASI